jgi:hypothetical protein
VSPHFGDAIVSAATFFRSSPNDRKQSALTLLLQFAGRESPRPTSPTLKALHESKTGPSVGLWSGRTELEWERWQSALCSGPLPVFVSPNEAKAGTAGARAFFALTYSLRIVASR